jgi:LuxR family transcriptional regulator, maltose regulon positive regulatory protein
MFNHPAESQACASDGHEPGAFISQTEVVHFRRCGYPPNGGSTYGDKGETLIHPRSSNLFGTGTLPTREQPPFLATKILPARFGGLVPRPRLVALLSELPARRLAVIKAPAGFGKTSLAAAWAEKLEQSGNRVGWLTIDSDDDEATRFLYYVSQALYHACPDVGAGAIGLISRTT